MSSLFICHGQYHYVGTRYTFLRMIQVLLFEECRLFINPTAVASVTPLTNFVVRDYVHWDDFKRAA